MVSTGSDKSNRLRIRARVRSSLLNNSARTAIGAADESACFINNSDEISSTRRRRRSSLDLSLRLRGLHEPLSFYCGGRERGNRKIGVRAYSHQKPSSCALSRRASSSASWPLKSAKICSRIIFRAVNFRRRPEHRVAITDHGSADRLGGGTSISQGELTCGCSGLFVEQKCSSVLHIIWLCPINRRPMPQYIFERDF